MARISLRSCPAQNPRPLAASTTTRTVGSAARRSKVDCSSSMSALESALNWPGRLSVSVATPSFVSVSSRASVCVVAFDVMRPCPRLMPFDSRVPAALSASTGLQNERPRGIRRCSYAWRSRPSRKSGCAMPISALARSATDFPFRLTIPYSVTMNMTSERGVVTTLP